jgi:hypothetical protein
MLIFATTQGADMKSQCLLCLAFISPFLACSWHFYCFYLLRRLWICVCDSSVPLPSLLLEQGRTKGKAAIDVVGAQAGKSGGSVLQQALLLASGGGLAGILPVLAGCYFAMAHVCAGDDGARGTGRMGWRANGLLCALRDMSL